MKALRKMPGGTWQMIEIANTLEALQEQVGGHIEAVTLATDACLLCDEEGRIKGRPINYAFGRMFCGPVLLVGVDGAEFCDIPEAMLRCLGLRPCPPGEAT